MENPYQTITPPARLALPPAAPDAVRPEPLIIKPPLEAEVITREEMLGPLLKRFRPRPRTGMLRMHSLRLAALYAQYIDPTLFPGQPLKVILQRHGGQWMEEPIEGIVYASDETEIILQIGENDGLRIPRKAFRDVTACIITDVEPQFFVVNPTGTAS